MGNNIEKLNNNININNNKDLYYTIERILLENERNNINYQSNIKKITKQNIIMKNSIKPKKIKYENGITSKLLITNSVRNNSNIIKDEIIDNFNIKTNKSKYLLMIISYIVLNKDKKLLKLLKKVELDENKKEMEIFSDIINNLTFDFAFNIRILIYIDRLLVY